ncbi:hypothetical protein M430DRAFT_264479, partial [Amorphotheca resinae ATCC 22711]
MSYCMPRSSYGEIALYVRQQHASKVRHIFAISSSYFISFYYFLYSTYLRSRGLSREETKLRVGIWQAIHETVQLRPPPSTTTSTTTTTTLPIHRPSHKQV